MVKAGQPLKVDGRRLWEPSWFSEINFATHPPNLGRKRGHDDEGARILRLGDGKQ